MTPTPPPAPERLDTRQGPLGRRGGVSRVAHAVFWTALFYLLTYGVARLSEWLAAR